MNMNRKHKTYFKQWKNIWIVFPALLIVFSFLWLMGFAYPVYRTIYLETAEVLQGNIFQVIVTGVRTNAYISCWYKGTEIPLYSTDDQTRRGLVSIPVLEKQGEKKLTLVYQNFWEELKKDYLPFVVTEGIFKKERIRFSKKKRKLYGNPKVPGERKKIVSIYHTETPEQMWDGRFLWPVKRRITSPFGARRVYELNQAVSGYHRGIDISAPAGTTVYAANTGVVIFSEKLVLSGFVVVLDHGQGVLSIYKHLSKVCVRDGEKVSKGDLIGLSGSGGLSTGAHLHWEIRVHSIPANPLQWIEEEF